MPPQVCFRPGGMCTRNPPRPLYVDAPDLASNRRGGLDGSPRFAERVRRAFSRSRTRCAVAHGEDAPENPRAALDHWARVSHDALTNGLGVRPSLAQIARHTALRMCPETPAMKRHVPRRIQGGIDLQSVPPGRRYADSQVRSWWLADLKRLHLTNVKGPVSADRGPSTSWRVYKLRNAPASVSPVCVPTSLTAHMAECPGSAVVRPGAKCSRSRWRDDGDCATSLRKLGGPMLCVSTPARGVPCPPQSSSGGPHAPDPRPPTQDAGDAAPAPVDEAIAFVSETRSGDDMQEQLPLAPVEARQHQHRR